MRSRPRSGALRAAGLGLLLTSLSACEDDASTAGMPADAGLDAAAPVDAGDADDVPPHWDFGQVPDGAGRFGAPELLSVEPGWGSTLGGTTVVLRGRGFLHADSLRFGGMPAPDWTVHGTEEIVAVTPPGEAGPADVEVGSVDGHVVLGSAFFYVADVSVDSVEPAEAPVAGGTRFVLRGAGLSRDVVILLGDHAVIAPLVVSDSVAEGVFPANPPGPADLWVFAGDGSDRAVVRGAVRYRVLPEPAALLPPAGPLSGGTPVEVTGAGFEADVTVVLGGVRVEPVRSADGRRLRFSTPPSREPGPVALSLHSPVGDGLLPAAFTYAEDPGALALRAVRPDRGPSGGGNAVEIVTTGASGDLEVELGGVRAACRDLLPGVVECEAPPHSPGAVEVSVGAAEGTVRVPGAYVYLPEISIESVAPSQGGAAGGAIATVVGDGFVPGAEVRFGALASPRVRWISERALTAVVPPGTAGEADVTVRDPELGRSATLPGGYTYLDEFRLLAVDPDHGARSGGTYVSLLGTGFTPGLVPDLDDRPVTDVRFRGATRYTFRTPAAAPGTVTVGILGVATLREAFTYFDPTTRYGGTWGHAVHGQVNVTLLDSYEGEGVEGAFVMLGTDPATPYQGLTNEDGQVVLSGPGLVGPVSVTAGKDLFETQTVVGFDAENVTLYALPLVPPISEGEGEGPPPRPTGTISGTVDGIDKYVPDPSVPEEVRIAYVQTTKESIYGSNPPPGTGGELLGDGPFVITSRPGDVALVVVAGLLNEVTGEFAAYRMGVARWLYVPIDGEVTDVAVVLTIPLMRRLGVTLHDAPLDVPDGPNQVICTPWFEFRPEGWFGGYNRFTGWGRDFWVEGMPLWRGVALDGVGLHLLTELRRDGSRPMTSRWSYDLPWDVWFVDVGPFVGIPRLYDPPPNGALVNHRFAWEVLGGVPPDVWSIRMMTQSYTPVWRVVMGGGATVLRLPDVPTLPGFPPGQHLMTFGGGLRPGFSMDRWEYGDLSTRGWIAWSSEWDEFRVAD